MIKQSQFRQKTYRDFVYFDDVFYVLETMSKKNFSVLKALFPYFEMKARGDIDSVFPCRETIAKKAKCSVRTVTSFLSSFSCFVETRLRKTRDGKNESNIYEMPKSIFFFFKTLAKYGLFKSAEDHKPRAKSIRKIYEEMGSCQQLFISRAGDPKYQKNKVLDRQKQDKTKANLDPPNKNFARGFGQKLPAIFISNSLIKESIEPSAQNRAVPIYLPKKIEKAIQSAYDDYEWYSTKNPVRSVQNFIASRLTHYLQAKINVKKQAQPQKADNPSEYKPGKSWNSYTNSWTAPRPTVQETPKKYRYELGT